MSDSRAGIIWDKIGLGEQLRVINAIGNVLLDGGYAEVRLVGGVITVLNVQRKPEYRVSAGDGC